MAITIHIGPMGSGKTENLIKIAKNTGKDNCILVCPKADIDTRNAGKIVSRNKRSLEPDTYNIDSFFGLNIKHKVLLIDEYHLFHDHMLGGSLLNNTLGIQSSFFNDESYFKHVHVFVINNLINGYKHLDKLVTEHNPNIKYYGCTKSKNHHIKINGDTKNSILSGGDDVYKKASEAEFIEFYLKGTLIDVS